jgi:hypothetical protein
VEQRELFIVPRRGGGYAVKGVLDDELGAAWLAVLSPYAAPRPADDVTGGDPRSPAHRTADALADLIRLATSHPDVTSVHGSKPTVVVTLDYATLTSCARTPPRWTGRGPSPPKRLAASPATLASSRWCSVPTVNHSTSAGSPTR